MFKVIIHNIQLFKSWIYLESQAILLGTSVLLLLVSIVAIFHNTNQLIKHNSWVNHTYEVNDNLENIYSNTSVIAASMHGYLLTGNPSFESSLKSYESDLMQHYDKALRLTTDNAKQQVRLKQLKPLLDERINLVKEQIKVRREHGLNVAIAAVITLSSEELTNQIHQRISVLKSEENGLLIKRQQDAQKSSSRMYFILSICALLGLSILIFLFASLKKQLIKNKKEAILLKKAEAEIRKLAFFDTLTKLPNRRLLNDRLSQNLAASKRTGCYGALMFLDLDNFKPLNDTHGHEVGDRLLIEAANRLTSCIREMDTVARFGGDEFVVMLSELDEDKTVSTTQAAVIAEKIRTTLSEPYQFTISHEAQADICVEHRCTGSIGVVVFNGSEGSQDDLMKWADATMYEAKNAGRNQIRFYAEKD